MAVTILDAANGQRIKILKIEQNHQIAQNLRSKFKSVNKSKCFIFFFQEVLTTLLKDLYTRSVFYALFEFLQLLFY